MSTQKADLLETVRSLNRMRPFVVCWTVLHLSSADITPFLVNSGGPEEIGCVDSQGGRVGDGDRYTPKGNDPCEQCTCQKGRPDSCSITSCYPPAQCSAPYLRRSGQCCDYACNGTATDGGNGNGTLSATNLGLRLVASTVTSFLILALLLFMIHRLRKRRLLVMIRRVDNCRRELDEACIAHHFALQDAPGVGYFMGRDRICDEPPPPYTFWKPPEAYVPPGEAPPPYEALGVLCGEPVASLPALPQHCDQVSRITQTTPCDGEEALSNSSSDEGADAVIRSDAYYEDGVSTLSRCNVTVVHLRGNGQSSDCPLESADVESTNEAVVERDTANPQPSKNIPTSQHASNCKQGERFSLYCETTPQTFLPNGAKRLSVPARPNSFSSFPDPTHWNAREGGSETSSSSASPDHSRGAFSPTSSESSCCSGDADFPGRQPPCGSAESSSTLPARAKGSLDRTLQCLRRFSFPGKKVGKKMSKRKADAGHGEEHPSARAGGPEAVNAATVELHRPPLSDCVSSLSLHRNLKETSGAQPVVITVHCQDSRTSGPLVYDVGNARLSRSNSICSETGERRYREQPRADATREPCTVSVQPHSAGADAVISRQNVARQVARLEAEGFRPQCAGDRNGRRHRKSPSNVSAGRTSYGGCKNGDGASAL